MTGFTTSTQTMATASNHVAEVNAQIQSLLRTLQGEVEAAQGFWAGQAAVSYQRLMANWNAEAASLNQALMGISQQLGTAGKKYADADAAQQASLNRIGMNFG